MKSLPRFFTSLSLFTSLFIGALLAQSPQAPPLFRGGVDLRQLDVTVQDKNRRPVRGLTAGDFRIEEEGQARKIEAFSFVDLPDVVSTEPSWARTTVSDVVSNKLESARVFALVVDDVGGMGDLWADREMKKSVATFVDQLGPSDIAGVVFPAGGVSSQNFTRDKARLAKSVEWYGTRVNTLVGAIAPGACDVPRRPPITMLYVAETLATMKNTRKVIVYFGGALNFSTGVDPCGVGKLWEQVLQAANENNISVYPVDTMGLRPQPRLIGNPYLSLARETGGHAVLFSNSFDEGLKRIFAENSSYYLLAYQPVTLEADGRFRQVTVKVNRPNVDVTSTRSYWAPKVPTAKHPAPPPPPPDVEALAGVLPNSQLSLRATGAAFAGDGQQGGVIALSLGVLQPAFHERTRESVDLLIRKFTPDGIDYGTDTQLIPVVVPAAPAGIETSAYDLLARIEVPQPGRYEIRVSAHSDATDTRGSIYVDVDVPDFRKDKVSLSGVVLNSALGAVPVAPARLLRDVVPIAPTTLRVFSTADIVTAFVRVYQGADEKLIDVPLRITVQDAAGKSVFSKTESLTADRFAATQAADYQFRLPLTTLKPGEHLLTFEATAGKMTARRDVRFHVR
jgi:VWFA-related protein